jgi:hypothetical protein
LIFLTRQFQDFKHKDLFYKDFLSVLFFDTLNTKRQNDLVELVKNQPCRIPYLNGGLFEEDNKNYRNLIFPSSLFEGLFNFFDQYNFTIYEDDPNDHTIAVDPEMLGHIFENLLEDNKDKGAYYTPKEIVHYMCQESLIEYLTTWFENRGYEIIGYASLGRSNEPQLFPINEMRTGQLEIEIPIETPTKNIDRILIEKLLKKALDDQDKALVQQHSTEFHLALDSVKICDPAIGSGAFPMGLLHEIFTAKQTLYSFEFGSTKTFDASAVKLNIIQNSIYGVDIERGAVDIARLRFWLSLIVDEDQPKALPNLDYKIVVGNSLVSKLNDEVINIDWNIDETAHGLFGQEFVKQKGVLLNQISQFQKAFFSPDSNKKKLTIDIRNLKIDLLINQLELMVDKGPKTEPKAVDFKDKKKFVTTTELYYETLGWKSTIKQLKVLKTKPELLLDFFDWKLDFPEVMNGKVVENVGFDIVIGNPPYIQLQKDGGKLADMFSNKGFETFERTGDIYSIFYEKGVQLAKIEGILIYITSNKWMRTGYGKSTRAFFSKHNPLKIIDLGSGIFESATVDTNILLLQKIEKPTNKFKLKALDISKIKSIHSFADFNTQWVILDQLSDKNWTILDSKQNNIKRKIERIGKPLKDWDVNIYRGVLTGFNEAFIIDTATKEYLCKQDPKSSEIIKPILRGRDIKKYKSEWAGLWLITTFSALQINIDNYPVVKKYLQGFGKRIHQTGEDFIDESGKKAKTRKRTANQWFETSDQIGYYKEFEKEKIIYPNMTLFLPFIYDNKEFYSNDKSFILTSKNISLKFLLSYFNSSFAKKWIRENCPELQDGTRELRKIFFKNIPIPNISEKIQKCFIERADKILILKLENKDTTILEQEIDNLVYKIYELTYEEVKIIDPEFPLTEQDYQAITIESTP